ncbi:MAG: ATP-binding domain-containing protein [Myxococcales bacterium]|nr:ATP-binding domain-containing protein [Myxococcales bacterium]
METTETRPKPHPEPPPSEAASHSAPVPEVVAEEDKLLRVVLSKIDKANEERRKPKNQIDDLGALIELRDALAEAKPEDQASLLEQMHRIEALARQRGKGENIPIDRRSPYFGHLRLEEHGKRRDVLIGQRGYVEPGGGVQIVDWRNAPVSRLFYRYEEGDSYEERLGNRVVEGEILARRTVTIVDADLRRVVSPDGTFARDFRSGEWRQVPARHAKLQVERDGSASVVKGAEDAAPSQRGRLSAAGNEGRLEKLLPAIAALIDPRQFELISRPSSGLIVVQGSAGSGKTTIGLHRIAYLAFSDPRRFRPERMLVVVYQRALATYVSRVLPSLEVPGVPVMTFADWAEKIRHQVFPGVTAPITDATPSIVVRLKSHGAILKVLEDRQAGLAAWCRAEIESQLEDRGAARAHALAAWDKAVGPVDLRVTALGRWVKDATLSPADRLAVEALGKSLRRRTRDVVGEWASLLTDRGALGEGFARHAPGVFSESQLDAVHRWCVDRERLRHEALDQAATPRAERRDEAGEDDDDQAADEPVEYALDAEDDALLLRLYQLQRGPLANQQGPVVYEHLMIDEVQDFAPIELAVLLDSTTSDRSITLAGDTAQAISADHGFSNWSDMLDDLGIPHDRLEPLRVSYRSTRQIVEAAEHVLGHLAGDNRPLAPRTGAPVEAFSFGSAGEASDFLGQALKELLREDPTVSVALVARHPEQARTYYDVLKRSEVPRLRLVAHQDFTFLPGIDVTDVRQTKGLEFDVVILLEVNDESYPDSDLARRLLHVAMTRAAHQLWITMTGRPSPLLPDELTG